VENTRLVDNLFEFVRIPSESGSEQQFLDYLAEKLTREAGAVCGRDDYGNLVGTIAGKASQAVEPLLFAMHGDTVKPGIGIVPELRDGVISSAGDTVLGADCKAGIAEFLEAVLSADRHPPLEFVVTREEEIGFVGARNLDYNLLSARRGFLLDMDAIDEVVVGGPSAMLVDVEIIGKAAHAGMEPEKGVSAIRAAAEAITRLTLGRLDHETTANIGTINGGTATNIIPSKVSLSGEVRSLDHDKCVRIADDMQAVFRSAAAESGASAKTEAQLLLQAYSIDPESDLVRAVVESLVSVGIEPRVVKITGGLESTIYNEHGIQVVPIGNGARAEHTTEECVHEQDMERIVEVVKRLFDRFA
jgi:tripeptide aminopeptidase